MKTNQTNQNSSELQSRPEQVGTAGEGKQKSYVSFKQRENNRQMATGQVLEALRRWMPLQYGLAQVVGQWVWIRFEEPPVEQVRRELSELGFHWNAKRQTWQHPCGNKTAGNTQDPRTKYGSHFPATRAA